MQLSLTKINSTTVLKIKSKKKTINIKVKDEAHLQDLLNRYVK